MRFGKAIKKIVALAAGATMLGATILSATAGNLANWPDMFAEDGTWNAVFVVGDDAKPVDVTGGMDLIAGTYLTVEKEVEVTEVRAVGDAVQIKESTDFLEYEEPLNGVTSVLTSDDLDLLKEGEISNAKGTFTYKHYLYTPEASVQHTVDPDDEEDRVLNYLVFSSGNKAYEYKIEFPTALESDVDATTGEWEDLHDEKITIAGVEYTIIDTSWTDPSLTLTLMGGAAKGVLNEGETASFEVAGVTYEITADYIDDDSAMFIVNGETTDDMEEGETYKLEDGTEIGVEDVMCKLVAGATCKVSFWIGAQKVELTDTNITDNNWGNELEINEESIDDTAVMMVGSEGKLSTIAIKYTPDEDIYIGEGGKLSEKVEEEGQLFGNFDIEFRGVSYPEGEEINLKRVTDTRYNLEFTNRDGDLIDVPFFYSNGTDVLLGKEDDKKLVYDEENNASDKGWMIEKDYYFVLTEEDSTYVLQYRGSEDSDDTLEFKNLGTGETFEITYEAGVTGNVSDLTAADSDGDATIILGGKEFYVWVEEDEDDTSISVDLNADEDLKDDVYIVTKYETTIYFDITSDGYFIVGPDSDKFDDFLEGLGNENVKIDVKVDDTTGDLYISGITYGNEGNLGDGTFMTPLKEEVDDEEGYMIYGARVFDKYREDAPHDVLITVPKDQAEALVFVTSGAITYTEVGKEVEKVPIGVGAVKLASQIADVTAQNLVVIGGPCANPIAAELLGVAMTWPECAAGLSEGDAVIKVIQDTGAGKSAVLVYGFRGEDTWAACRALVEKELSGEEVKLKVRTYEDYDVLTT